MVIIFTEYLARCHAECRLNSAYNFKGKLRLVSPCHIFLPLSIIPNLFLSLFFYNLFCVPEKSRVPRPHGIRHRRQSQEYPGTRHRLPRRSLEDRPLWTLARFGSRQKEIPRAMLGWKTGFLGKIPGFLGEITGSQTGRSGLVT